MKFIEVTRKTTKSMININHIVQFYPYKGYCKIVLNRINDSTTLAIGVAETYEEVKKLIESA